MRFFKILIWVVILVVIIVQAFFILKEVDRLNGELAKLNERIGKVDEENSRLRAEIDYFSIPENLEKKLKTEFNYRKPDEKMLIIVPQ